MKRLSPDATVALVIAIALHVALIALLIRFGSIRPKPIPVAESAVQIEGAGGAVRGLGSPEDAVSAVPNESVATCAYSLVDGSVELDSATTPKRNPSFENCPATILQLSSALTKPGGVFKVSLRHGRVQDVSIIESSGDSRTDSAIVASIGRQGIWISDTGMIRPEWIAYIVKIRN